MSIIEFSDKNILPYVKMRKCTTHLILADVFSTFLRISTHFSISALPLIRILLITILILATLPSPAQYQAIDRHALRAPHSLRDSLPGLVDYLLEPARTEREKARSLYTWLTHTITYDEDASRQERRINQSTGDILRRGHGICFDFSVLYAELCRQAGLQCVSVSGYSRQGLGAMEMPSTPNHSWNAIFLEGQWRLADPTWGIPPGQDELTANYDTDYFLTPPRLFILNHLPAMPMWQLLPCPITPGEFSRPAEGLLPLIEIRDSCFNYPDTIWAFLQLPAEEQRLREAGATYRFHPTAGNKRMWAQATIDYAVFLSEKAEPLQRADSLEAFLEIQREAVGLCRKAQELTPLLPWQTEFFAGLLINRAVALNRLSNEVEKAVEELALLKTAKQHLEEAQETLLGLPEDNYYRQYASQQCAAYLEVVNHNIRRLE